VVNSVEYMVNLDHAENCEIVVNHEVELTIYSTELSTYSNVIN